MLKKLNLAKRILNYLGAALSLAMLVMQFVPFWTYGEKTASINSFVWLKATDGELTGWLASNAPGFNAYTDMNSLVLAPVLMFVLCILGAIFCAKNAKAAFISLLPFFCGVIGIIGYLTQPVLQLGDGWIIHIAISAALALVGLVATVFGAIVYAKGDRVKKERKIIKKLA